MTGRGAADTLCATIVPPFELRVTVPDFAEPATGETTEQPAALRWTLRDKATAWAIHAFTLTGLLWATLAVVALLDGELQWMWLWLGVALVVDGVDGNLARKYRIAEVIPWFSGTVVDHVVDYLTWTAIPVLFMAMHLPLGPRPMMIALSVLILVSSMFCYANEAAKSQDNYFVGFPAAWNIVAVLLWVWNAPMVVCVAVILVFSAMTLVPLYYTHPFRVERGKTGNILATVAWIVTTGVLVALSPVAHAGPGVTTTGLLFLLNILAGGWIISGGVRRSLRGRVDQLRSRRA